MKYNKKSVNINSVVKKWTMSKDEDIDARNAEFNACKKHGIPSIHFIAGRKRGRLEWDLITTEPETSDAIESGGADALAWFHEYQKLAQNTNGAERSKFSGTYFVGYIE
ncbi:MAG: hypothetical protein ING19_19970, partial [Azospirillum sp.]|nr:hypothetical protein [Azospirillum sp.]